MKVIFLASLLLASAVRAETKFYVDGQEVELGISEATRSYIESTASDFANSCKAYRMIERAMSDFTKIDQFPFPSNKYPASEVLGGLLDLRDWGRSLGYGPSLHFLIEIAVVDGDKAFDRDERDNVVALWSITVARTPLNCT